MLEPELFFVFAIDGEFSVYGSV